MPVAPLSRRRFLALSGAAAAQAALGCGTAAESANRSATGPVVDPGPLAAGNTAFATDLFGQLRSDPGNLFLSPFSISAALAMTSAGAKGETLAEMNKVL